MKVFLYTFIALFFLTACSEKKEQIIVEVPALKASEIYQNNAVKKYVLRYSNQHHDIASSYLKKSNDIKDRNLKKAIYFLKRSISLEPAFESYKTLIKLLSEDKNYSEALSAYYILARKAYFEVNEKWEEDYIFSAPDEDLITECIVMSVLANDALDYYTLSLAGDDFDKQKIRTKLLADERFKIDSSSIVYKNIMIQFWTEEEVEAYKKSLVNLNALLASVKDTSSTFEINQKNVNRFRYDDFNGMNYSEEYNEEGIVLTDMFVYYLKEKQENPNRWFQYNITHTFNVNDSLKALVYAVDTSAIACPIEMREIYHRLVIYGADGKLLSDKIIACQSGGNLQTVVFNKDHFEITEYSRIWRKPYNKQDFDNDITNIAVISKKMYSITPTGVISESIVVQ